MSFFTVDTTACTRCGICVEACPMGGIIEIPEPGDYPSPTARASVLCINCGHCVAVCPSEALSLETMPLETLPPANKNAAASPEKLAHLMRTRRSIRQYRQEKVDQSSIETLINTSSYAPSGHNVQDVKWLVFSDRDAIEKTAKITIEWMRYLQNEGHPAARIFGVKRLIAAWDAGKDLILRNAPHFIATYARKDNGIAVTNSTIALTWFELLAHSSGIGACWAGYVHACSLYWPPMNEALDLPDENVLCGAMMFGYPKYDYKHIPTRRDPDVTWR